MRRKKDLALLLEGVGDEAFVTKPNPFPQLLWGYIIWGASLFLAQQTPLKIMIYSVWNINSNVPRGKVNFTLSNLPLAACVMFYPVVTYFKTEVHSQNSWQDVTLVLSSMSFEFRSAWLILKTIQSKRALYNDLAMEFRTVTAWKEKRKRAIGNDSCSALKRVSPLKQPRTMFVFCPRQSFCLLF